MRPDNEPIEYAEDFESPFMSAARFWAGVDEVTWLVEGLLPDQSLSIVAGKPKSMKTIFAMNLAIAVSLGSEFLGRPCRQGIVGFLQLEDSKALILKRFKSMIGKPPPELFICSGVASNEELRMSLQAFVNYHGMDLLIIDPLIFWRPGTKENNAAEMAALMNELRGVVHETGCSILLVHHSRKGGGDQGDAIRGSSAILAAVDIALEIRKENQGRACLKVISRFGEVEDETLGLDVASMTLHSLGSVREAERSSHRQEVLSLLEAVAQPLTAAEIMGSLDLPRATLYRLLQDMELDESISSTEGTSTTRGGRKSREYFLSSHESSLTADLIDMHLGQTQTKPEQAREMDKEGLSQSLNPMFWEVDTNQKEAY